MTAPTRATRERSVDTRRDRRRIEVSREGFRLFEVGDIDALVELYDGAATLWHPEGWPESGPTVGRGAIKRQFERLREGWSDHHVIVEQIEGRGDWVVARVRWQARGSESGAEVEVSYSAASRFDEEAIVEVRYCWTHEDALRAAGWSRSGTASGGREEPIDESGGQRSGKPKSP